MSRMELREKLAEYGTSQMAIYTDGEILSTLLGIEPEGASLSDVMGDARSVKGIGKRKAAVVDALRMKAVAIILVHNHPSGDVAPSREDVQVTKRMADSGKILDIPVLDHIIVGDGNFASLKDRGHMS